MLTLATFLTALAIPFPAAHRSPTASETAPDSVQWAPQRRGDALTRGTALSHVLASRGFDSDQIRDITRLLAGYRNARTLRPGTKVRFSATSQGVPTRIRLELTPDSVLDFVRADSIWTSRLSLVPFVVDTVRISALVESSLWSSRLSGDTDRFPAQDFEELVYNLADIFAWKVDFTRDLRRGDEVRVVLERKLRPDGSLRSRHFLAIELKNRGRVLRAIPMPRQGGGWTYYDETGASLRGAFLMYPVPYRITSHFTNRRFHPILKRYRPHEGIDYGAPIGTPVEATASGIVSRADWTNGYGRLVELRHPQGIRTRYAHLSAFGNGIHSGAHVEQGQIIGKVGMSGLATGPHLHYEFLQNGKHRNPLTVQLPSAPSIDRSRLAEFRLVRDHALALLEGSPLGGETLFTAAVRPARTPDRVMQR